MSGRAIHRGVGYNALRTGAFCLTGLVTRVCGGPFREKEWEMKLRQRLYVIFLICVLPVTGTLWAQGVEATLKGRVTDPSGAAVPGAKVEVKNTGTNQLTPTVTDSAGQYTVPFLQPGAYT